MLYQNDGAGTFVDVAASEGVDDGTKNTMAPVWLDYDGDGDSDLFVANVNAPNELFRNELTGANGFKVDLVSSVSAPNGNGAKVTAVAGGARQVRYPDGGSGYLAQNVTPT